VDPEVTTDASSSADSSSATTEPAADSSQATTQPAQQTQTPEPPFHQHPRFRELTSQNRELKQQIAQLSQAMQRFQQTQAQPGQPRSPEEQWQRQQAIQALKQLLGEDPELKNILELAKQKDQFQQQFQGIGQMQQQAAQAHNHAARAAIKELAAADNLPTDDASMRQIVRLVAGEAMSLENGDERYKSGDMGVLSEAYENIKPWLASLRKPAEQSLVQTKNKLKQLPKPAQGSAPGQPAMPKMQPGKEREYEQSLHGLARKMLLEG
jgi:hypothetical protein